MKEDDTYIVPKEELPKGISFRKIYGQKVEKPEKTVHIQKILTHLEGTKGNRA